MESNLKMQTSRFKTSIILLIVFFLASSSASAFQTEEADFPLKPDFSIEITPTGLVSIIATCNDGINNQGDER